MTVTQQLTTPMLPCPDWCTFPHDPRFTELADGTREPVRDHVGPGSDGYLGVQGEELLRDAVAGGAVRAAGDLRLRGSVRAQRPADRGRAARHQ